MTTELDPAFELILVLIAAACSPQIALLELLVEKGALTQEEMDAKLTKETVETIAMELANKLKSMILEAKPKNEP